MPRDHAHYLQNMLDAITKVSRYTKDVDYEKFCVDELLLDAVVRNLEIIGEAAKNVPQGIREQHLGSNGRRSAGSEMFWRIPISELTLR